MNSPAAATDLAEALGPRSEKDTRLHGHWLMLARIVCLTLCGVCGLLCRQCPLVHCESLLLRRSLYVPYVWTRRRAKHSRAWDLHHRP